MQAKHAAALAGAILALILAVALLKPAPATTPEPEGNGFQIVQNDKTGRLVLEAEPGTSEGEIAAPFVLKDDGAGPVAEASGGRCVYIGPEKWNEHWKKGQVEGEWTKGHPQADYPGFVRRMFHVEQPGDYEIWIRVFWVDDCGNSLSLSLNDGPLSAVSGTVFGRWTWNPLRNAEMETKRVRLNAGANTLVFCNREDDLYVDQILIRKADRSWPDPVGVEQ